MKKGRPRGRPSFSILHSQLLRPALARAAAECFLRELQADHERDDRGGTVERAEGRATAEDMRLVDSDRGGDRHKQSENADDGARNFAHGARSVLRRFMKHGTGGKRWREVYKTARMETIDTILYAIVI